MEGGRQIEAAKEILSAKNVPYFVAAPLLIQDADSWQKGGVQGLQTVVLYALPELDGAIETVVLGGLVGGDKIIVMPERVRRLADRLKVHRCLFAFVFLYYISDTLYPIIQPANPPHQPTSSISLGLGSFTTDCPSRPTLIDLAIWFSS